MLYNKLNKKNYSTYLLKCKNYIQSIRISTARNKINVAIEIAWTPVNRVLGFFKKLKLKFSLIKNVIGWFKIYFKETCIYWATFWISEVDGRSRVPYSLRSHFYKIYESMWCYNFWKYKYRMSIPFDITYTSFWQRHRRRTAKKIWKLSEAFVLIFFSKKLSEVAFYNTIRKK